MGAIPRQDMEGVDAQSHVGQPGSDTSSEQVTPGHREGDPGTENPCLAAALDYLARGWCPIPIRSEGTTAERKQPLIPWQEYQECRSTEEEVRGWWRQWPTANVGLVMGKVSGTFALDLDGDARHLLDARGVTLPHTPTSKTGKGMHVLFQHPGQAVSNRVALLKGSAPSGTGPVQVDVRGDGGYIVAPPSIHGNGHLYEWVIPCTEALAPAPEPLLKLMLSREEETQPRPVEQASPSWVVKALEGPIVKGTRNDTATRLAGHFLPKLGNKVAEVTALLGLWASTRCQPPLDPRELHTVVESVAQREATRADSFRSPKEGDGTKSNFQPIHIADLLASEPTPIVWCWERFIPEGSLVALVSYMKVGKSTLAYPLAIAMAQGQPFLGYATTQGGVLILAVEEHERDVRRRLERFGARTVDPIYVQTGHLQNVPELFLDLHEFITEHQIRLVLLDTLPQFWSVRDENDNAGVTRQVKPFLDLARSTQAAVVLLHHERKSEGEHGRNIRGGSAFFGLVDQAILLDRRQGGAPNQRVLKTIGRYDESPPELVLELTPEGHRNLGTKEELDLEASKATVFDALSSTPVEVDSVATKTGLAVACIRRALKALGHQVVKEGRGVKGDPFTYRRAA